MASERALFELTMLGGAVERRYRRLRPEVEVLPWASLDLSGVSREVVLKARSIWTEAAFQEHRTAAACAATLGALIAARAPVDLVAMATRFPLDEIVHVELTARLAQMLGGAAPIHHNPAELIELPSSDLPVLLQAADLVVRNFCVGEALSIPVLRGAWHSARQPLIKAILGRIVKDEAAHGAFGWIFLEWAEEQLSVDDRLFLSKRAAGVIDHITARWSTIEAQPAEDATDPLRLGWLESGSYLSLAKRALQESVIEPLCQFGLDPRPHLASPLSPG